MVQPRPIIERSNLAADAGAGLPTSRPLLPVRGADGRYSSELPAEIVREIARRLQAGDPYDEISASLGVRKATGRRKCAEIAQVLGLTVERSRYENDTVEVLRRVEQGEDDHQIAAALGRTASSVSQIRRKHGIRYFTQLRISDDENAEIERRLLAGQSTRTVAAAVGCNQADVQRRLRRVAHLIPKDLPPCVCGKPCNHGGRCNLIVDPQVIRDRLVGGKTTVDIAREFNRTPQSFKPKYVQPVIDQLTAEGHSCGCGRPFGHPFACSVNQASQRCTFTDTQRARAATLLREGASGTRIVTELGIKFHSATILVRELRSVLAAEGVHCPCGAIINHRRSCSARNGQVAPRIAFHFKCAAAANMPVKSRRKVSKLARDGWPISVIVNRTGESVWRVTQMVEELGSADLLPAKCAGCDLPRGHRAPCPKPAQCKCGRPRNHRGLCRRADGRKRMPVTKVTSERLAAIRRGYRDRQSIRTISRATGASFSTIQRLISQWREKSKYDLAPCACGKPARHVGSCWANRSGLVGKRHLTRIEQGIRDGRTSHAIAEHLKLSVMTVLKHSVPIRDRLFAAGVTCACGRALNHNFWCSARWDAHEMPRGRRPFPEPQETQAVEALLRGDVVADIAQAVGVGPDSVWRLRRTLSDDQRAQRARAMRDRLAIGRGLQGEFLMTRIKAAVPSRLDPVLRDDVISEIYLAVIEGRVEPEQIGAVIRSFVSRGMAQWQSAYGPRSLDEKLSADGNRTLADSIGDTTAALAIDEIKIGQPPP